MSPGPLLSTSAWSKIQTVWGTSRIRGRPLLTQHGGSVLSDVTSWVLEACLPTVSQAWEGIDCVLRGIVCILDGFVPWVSKLQSSVQSCSEAAQRSLSCLSVCLAASSLGSEPPRGGPLCVFSSTVYVVIYPVPSALGNWHLFMVSQVPAETSGKGLSEAREHSELIFSLVPGQPHYLDFSHLAPTSEPILLLCDGVPLTPGLGTGSQESVILHHGMPRGMIAFL